MLSSPRQIFYSTLFIVVINLPEDGSHPFSLQRVRAKAVLYCCSSPRLIGQLLYNLSIYSHFLGIFLRDTLFIFCVS